MAGSNFHTHCFYCDGAGEPAAYAAAAFEKGFEALGFSSHAPIPFENDWTMKEERVNDYFAAVDRLKKEYAGRMEIYTGLEMDYFDGDDRDVFNKYPVDYLIGSVHFFSRPGVNDHYSIDGSDEEFRRTLNEYFQGDIKQFVCSYYRQIIKMITAHRPAILGHLDVIRKNNAGEKYFSQEEAWYRDCIDEVLSVVRENGTIVEVNTGGMIRGYTTDTYPGIWILRECKKRDIPVMVNSDAHAAENIDRYFDVAFSALREAGYSQQMILKNNKWIEIGF